jgi:hypothetical protein
MAVVARDRTKPTYDPTALDPEADQESRRRARIWLWALLGLLVVAIGAVSVIGRQQETSVKKAPRNFCKAAKAYEDDIDRFGQNYITMLDRQIERVEEIAATAPRNVQADAELFLASLRAYEAAPDEKAREDLRDDPEVEAAIVNLNRRWNQGCDVFTRDSPL